MEAVNMFREIAQELDLYDIPVHYIAAAAHLDSDGMEHVVCGEEIASLLAHEHPYEDARGIYVVLNLRQLSIDVTLEANRLYNKVFIRGDDVE